MSSGLVKTNRFRRDGEGRLHKVWTLDGVDGFIIAYTASCSGCFEGGDYMGMARHYDYDEKAGCHVGGGCDECGYTGKRRETDWVPYDVGEYERRLQNDAAVRQVGA